MPETPKDKRLSRIKIYTFTKGGNLMVTVPEEEPLYVNIWDVEEVLTSGEIEKGN